MLQKPEAEKHETVGRLFRSFGITYRCIKYVKATGFFMQMVEGSDRDRLILGRKVGDVVDVSERAIGRTYHRVSGDESYETHADGCECKCCRKE